MTSLGSYMLHTVVRKVFGAGTVSWYESAKQLVYMDSTILVIFKKKDKKVIKENNANPPQK